MQKACVRNGGGKTSQVCIVWPTGTANPVFPSICWAATTCWTEVIWLKVSVVWCSPNVQSQLQSARLSFLTWWCTRLGDYPSTCSALQKLQSAFWQIYALITLPHPFCSGFSFFTKANTSQDCTKTLLSVMSFRLCSSVAQIMQLGSELPGPLPERTGGKFSLSEVSKNGCWVTQGSWAGYGLQRVVQQVSWA